MPRIGPRTHLPEFPAKEDLLRAVRILPPRQRRIIQFRYDLKGEGVSPVPLKTLAFVFRCHRERIRRLETKGRKRLEKIAKEVFGVKDE